MKKLINIQSKNRYIAVLLAISILAVLSLSACGGNDTQAKTGNEENSRAAETQAAETEVEKQEIAESEKPETEKPAVENTEALAEAERFEASEIIYDQMKVTALNVGQGLCLLIEADGHAMLYDGGGRDSSSYVVSYLKDYGYESFDYMVASHYDEDHIAGLIGCLHNYAFGKVLCPDYRTDTEIFRSFETTLALNGAEIVHPAAGDEFALGNAVVTVLGPQNYDAPKDNNNSIVIRAVYGEFSCIITGDAEGEEEEEILAAGMDIASDLYVVGHHGSAKSSCDAFVKAISPADALISCGWGNDYGHPAMEAIAVLENYGVNIYRTDQQGEITCETDAQVQSYSVPPCEDHSPGMEPLKEIDLSLALSEAEVQDTVTTDRGLTNQEIAEEDKSPAYQYVLNTNTKVFHYPYCSSVKQMKDKNRKDVEASRDDIIAHDYRSCERCNP